MVANHNHLTVLKSDSTFLCMNKRKVKRRERLYSKNMEFPSCFPCYVYGTSKINDYSWGNHPSWYYSKPWSLSLGRYSCELKLGLIIYHSTGAASTHICQIILKFWKFYFEKHSSVSITKTSNIHDYSDTGIQFWLAAVN